MNEDKIFEKLFSLTTEVRRNASKRYRRLLTPEDIAECEQLALIRAYHSFSAEHGHSFRNWLSMCVWQECDREYTRQQRQLSKVRSEGLLLHGLIADNAAVRKWRKETDRLTEFVKSLLACLSKRDRRIIEDHYFHGMPLQMIAERHGLSNAMAASRKVKAICERLRRIGEADIADYRQTTRSQRKAA